MIEIGAPNRNIVAIVAMLLPNCKYAEQLVVFMICATSSTLLHLFSCQSMPHVVIINSYIITRSRYLNKREVKVLCYRICTGLCLDHECISAHYVSDYFYW